MTTPKKPTLESPGCPLRPPPSPTAAPGGPRPPSPRVRHLLRLQPALHAPQGLRDQDVGGRPAPGLSPCVAGVGGGAGRQQDALTP